MNNKEKPLILLVDDNPQNLQVLGNLLEGDYYTAIATNGQEALSFANRRIPDLILLDIMMPVLNGFETCKQLKKNGATQDIPIIFLSAKTEAEDVTRGFELGAVDYVTKPFQKEELQARVKTHLKLKQTELALRESNLTKDKFFSIIAHDLKSPFNSLLGFSDLLYTNYDRYNDDKRKKQISMIQRSSRQLYNLVINLLEWSRIQADKIEWQPRTLDLSIILTQVIPLFETTAGEKGIAIENKITEGAGVYSDLNMVSAILRNLVSNALKFTGENGKISIASREKEKHLEIAVCDTGVGIRPDTVKDLFQISKACSTPGTRNEEGTGLGLLLCQEYVKKNYGKIWAESEYGKGSCFKFTLPKDPFSD